MVLTMPCEGREWLADVGFGGDGLLEPIALDGSSTEQAGYSITRGTDVQVHEITRQEVVPLLRDTFGIEVPEDARFRALDSNSDWCD
jgi:arylamine N-acetyltransferase